MRPTLTACLNGSRTRSEHAGVPETPAQIAAETRACAAAGADDVHVHPKAADGTDTIDPAVVGAVLTAVRASAPGVAVSLTTMAPPADRVAAVRAWPVLPDAATVNWHEQGTERLAEALLERGVALEAGLWTPASVRTWLASPLRAHTSRVLLEVDQKVPAHEAVDAARKLLAALGDAVPAGGVQLHGAGGCTWPVLDEALRLGLGTRIGLEDTLVRPDGTSVEDNQALVNAALTRPGY